ncbi:hypothetical protein ACIO13_16910 [Streptomyces sp. NPDC087425]|uniref:hypothetical protein n=1 Tax=Streptomyces sp. NPDC087425 TaxID=3365787 RepID=UPI0037F71BAE
MACTPIEVPESVAGPVVAYLAELRLTYGAFGSAVTTADDWYGAVAHAIAGQLEKGPRT